MNSSSRLPKWTCSPLSKFISNVIDYRGKTPPPAEVGVPVISAAHVKSGKVVHCGKKFVTKETYERWTTRGFIKPGDVLVTTEAPVGETAQVPGDRTYLITRRVIAIQFDELRAEPTFFKYVLLSDQTRKRFERMSHGTTVPRLYKEDILDLEIDVPPLPTQRKIASILSAYDDLIENNTRRIAILEEMAQAIYREWFVNFRFPGHENVKLVDSPLGQIPEGWEVTTLGAIADVNARSIKKGNAPDSINYIDIKSVSTGRIDEIRPMPFSESPGRARRIVRHGDVIWSTVRPVRRSYSIILAPLPDTIASTGFAVLSANTVPFSYVYFATTTDEFATYLVNHATGSAYPAVNGKDFENADVILPPPKILTQFDNAVGDMLVLGHRLLVPARHNGVII